MGILKIANTSGKYHDINSNYDLIHYIADPRKTIHGLYGGLAVSNDPLHAVSQMYLLRNAWEKFDCVQLRHMILSFREDELSANNPEHLKLLQQFAIQIASYYSSSYQIFYGIHENTNQLHIHFAMSMLNYHTGMQYTGKKKDLYDFLAHINRTLAPFNLSVEYVPNLDYAASTKIAQKP